MLIQVIGTGFVSLISWAVFAFFFHKDRSRYRNCYFLSVALASLIPFILTLSGKYMNRVAVIMMNAALLFLLIVPFFLIYNGIVMIRKEGKHLSQLLSLGLGIVILLGEAAFVATVFGFYLSDRFPIPNA